MKKSDLGGEPAEGGGDGVEFDLFDGGRGGGRRRVGMDHVVGAEEAEREVLVAQSVHMIGVVLVKVYLDVTFFLHLEMDVPELGYKVVDLDKPGPKISYTPACTYLQ